jgi:hypothetical protein
MPIAKATYTIRDAKNALAQTSVYIEFLDTITEGDGRDNPFELAFHYAQLLDALIDGAIVGIHVSTSVPLPGDIKDTPVARSDVEDGALFIWELENSDTIKQTIPTFSEDFMQIDGTIDISLEAEDDVLDWLLLTEAPSETPGDWALNFTDAYGNDILEARKGTQKFKKSRKGLD